MRFTQPLVSILVFLLSAVRGHAQNVQNPAAEQAPNEPDLAITPNTLRIEPLEKGDKEGHWVVMPGFSELGSPSFAPDGEWFAFDAYKEGYNNSPPESWIVRRDGKGLARLTNWAPLPRWSPDGSSTPRRARRGERASEEVPPGVFVVNRDGSDVRRIVDGRWPEWSPSGK